MERPFSSLTVAEYFAGIGLVRMGLQQHGWQVLFANDISKKKYEMYQKFFPDAEDHYVIDNIFSIDHANIPSTSLATCSFPCIDLSVAGNRNGIIDGRHSSAFWGFIDVLKTQGESSPSIVLIENVPGWLSSNEGADFSVTVKALNELGYACDVFILDALRFTPQSRLRVFLIGTKHKATEGAVELILTRPKSLLSERLRQSIIANKDLDWFYNDLPEPPPLRTKGLSEIVEKMDDGDERWWSDREVKRHLAMMAEIHRERVEDLARDQQYSFRTFYRRRRQGEQRSEVRNDDLSGCLRTAVGGSGKQFLIQAGYGKIQMRVMTPREYARLQGVPDHYVISARGVQALTGFGDAVCVPAIAWISEHVLTNLVDAGVSTYSRLLPACQPFLLER